MRNKKILLIGLLVIAILSLAVTGLSNPFSGIGSRLGGAAGRVSGSGIIYIIVNTLVIGIVLYFIANLIPFIKMDSKSAKFAVIGVILLFSVMFAMQIGSQFVWSAQAFSNGLEYLFKDTYQRGSETYNGILNPKHLWKFIGLSLIISWLFITFLKVGGEKHYIDIALSVLISANAVHNVVKLSSVIYLGQGIALIIITHQFSKQFGISSKWWNRIVSFGIAFTLILWISRIVFPGYGFLGIGDGVSGGGFGSIKSIGVLIGTIVLSLLFMRPISFSLGLLFGSGRRTTTPTTATPGPTAAAPSTPTGGATP
jgi:hypothetical protein